MAYSDKLPRRKRIVLMDANLMPVGDKYVMDITGVANANTQAPMMLRIEQQCDMLHWHMTDHLTPTPWGND